MISKHYRVGNGSVPCWPLFLNMTVCVHNKIILVQHMNGYVLNITIIILYLTVFSLISRPG